MCHDRLMDATQELTKLSLVVLTNVYCVFNLNKIWIVLPVVEICLQNQAIIKMDIRN
ncbi:11964_t:CDS:1, partial [Entrophospora sp. SA101]